MEKKRINKEESISSDSSGAMRVIYSDTIRGLVDISNEEKIRKDDVVSILYNNGQHILIYYK